MNCVFRWINKEIKLETGWAAVSLLAKTAAEISNTTEGCLRMTEMVLLHFLLIMLVHSGHMLHIVPLRSWKLFRAQWVCWNINGDFTLLGLIKFYWERGAAVSLQAGWRTDCIYILQLWGPHHKHGRAFIALQRHTQCHFIFTTRRMTFQTCDENIILLLTFFTESETKQNKESCIKFSKDETTGGASCNHDFCFRSHYISSWKLRFKNEHNKAT